MAADRQHEQAAATSDLDMAFAVLDQAERFVAKIEGPEDYALAPAIATARGEFRLLREALEKIAHEPLTFAAPGGLLHEVRMIARAALKGQG